MSRDTIEHLIEITKKISREIWEMQDEYCLSDEYAEINFKYAEASLLDETRNMLDKHVRLLTDVYEQMEKK